MDAVCVLCGLLGRTVRMQVGGVVSPRISAYNEWNLGRNVIVSLHVSL